MSRNSFISSIIAGTPIHKSKLLYIGYSDATLADYISLEDDDG
jgi:hypothetical protein